MSSAVARGQETELTALPSIGEDRWVSWVRDADVLLVDGGDATSLCHWLRASGLAALLPSLPELVWVGVSAGSMVLTPRIGDHFVEWSNAPDDRILGIVDFSIFPHLDYPGWPGNTLARRGSGSARSTARRTPRRPDCHHRRRRRRHRGLRGPLGEAVGGARFRGRLTRCPS
jgi:hypothetical protein